MFQRQTWTIHGRNSGGTTGAWAPPVFSQRVTIFSMVAQWCGFLLSHQIYFPAIKILWKSFPATLLYEANTLALDGWNVSFAAARMDRHVIFHIDRDLIQQVLFSAFTIISFSLVVNMDIDEFSRRIPAWLWVSKRILIMTLAIIVSPFSCFTLAYRP